MSMIEAWRWSSAPAAALACALLGLVPASAQSVTRLPVIDRAIAEHGGALYEASRTRLRLCSLSGCSDLDVRMDHGAYDYRVVGAYRDRERRVRVTNATVEHWLDGERQPVGDPEQEQSLRDWVMARVYFCFLPYRLNDPGVYKQDLGIESWKGRELHKVKVTFAAGSSSDAQDEYLFWLDPESGRVEQFAYSYERGDPGLRFRRGFNYRRVGGILFFDQENLGAEGEGLTVDAITPRFVETSLRPVSTVVLRDIRVDAVD